ncbi:CbtB-domain containing protein [Mycolicibacterium moriokaense]|nr:CbtB-domain containing protein [Mycolicibacterium moriokaense]
MAKAKVATQRTHSIDFTDVRAALWLAGTVFLALGTLYLVGLEQGATSVFGGNTAIHEFTHDARHLLGFPCH